MTRNWNGRWKHQRWDRDPWQYKEPESGYGWLKRTLVAIIIFGAVYGLYVSETSIGRSVADGVKYMLTTQTDFAYLVDQAARYAPPNMDVSVLKKVQTTISHPADPLLYMGKPVDGRLASSFGWRINPVTKQEMMHEGIDIDAPMGTAVKAAAAGKVKLVTDSAQYGKMLVIDHGQQVETVYGHLSEVLVKPDEPVSQNQVVARVGKTGIVNNPQLHFEVRENGKAIDPLTRIKGELTDKEGK
jgi:murein DD-endopeptidase MepM/ murein hydrolase activator NlpD